MRTLALLLILLAAGCAANTQRETTTEKERQVRRETVEVRQEVHDGQVVQLTTKTVTTEQETEAGTSQGSSRTEVEPPKILDSLKPLASAAATAVMGPAGGAAVNYLWETVAGLGVAGTTGGVGLVLRERKRREDEAELKRKLVKAQDDYARDLEDAETDDDVARVKAKHAERQRALGIHEQLTRERHGA